MRGRVEIHTGFAVVFPRHFSTFFVAMLWMTTQCKFFKNRHCVPASALTHCHLSLINCYPTRRCTAESVNGKRSCQSFETSLCASKEPNSLTAQPETAGTHQVYSLAITCYMYRPAYFQHCFTCSRTNCLECSMFCDQNILTSRLLR